MNLRARLEAWAQAQATDCSLDLEALEKILLAPEPTTSEPLAETFDQKVGRILMMTKDPKYAFPGPTGGPMPVLTTMLFRVCDNDPVKFEEATRLTELLVVAALQEREPA